MENIIYSVNFRSKTSLVNEVDSHSVLTILGRCLSTVAALLLGLSGLVLLFPTGSRLMEISTLMLFPLVAGAIIGFISPKTWGIAALAAWGGVIFLVIEPDKKVGMAVFAGYVILALLGGIAGRCLRLRKGLNAVLR